MVNYNLEIIVYGTNIGKASKILDLPIRTAVMATHVEPVILYSQFKVARAEIFQVQSTQ